MTTSLHGEVQNSRPEVFHKIDILKNFAEFIGKHLCHSLFNKFAGWRLQPYQKRDSGTGDFLRILCKIFRNTFFIEHLQVTASDYGTILRTGITCKKIPLQKSIELGMDLKWSTTRYKQKTEYFLLPDDQHAENLILVFDS